MNKFAKAAMKRTGKPYGGHIDNCHFHSNTYLGQPLTQNDIPMTIAKGDLRDDPMNHLSPWNNFNITTPYIIYRRKSYIETQNTIYTYTEVTDETA